MSDMLHLWEKPTAKEIYMIAGWRQWADSGSISSGLPKYLIEQTDATPIGYIDADACYLFQIPGTHDLVRPVISLNDGFPESLSTRSNEFFYTEKDDVGIVIFVGDEPHLGINRYTDAILTAAAELNVKRIIGLGGVFAELPYDKERPVYLIFSKKELRSEMERYGSIPSNYNGGASIGTVLAKHAADKDVEYIGFYSFVPSYNFPQMVQQSQGIRIENDFVAWMGILRRILYMIGWDFDTADLQKRVDKLFNAMEEKVEELDKLAPQAGIRAYMDQLSNNFEETIFMPLDDVWQEEISSLFDDFD